MVLSKSSFKYAVRTPTAMPIAKNTNIVARHKALETAYGKFFKENLENVLTTTNI